MLKKVDFTTRGLRFIGLGLLILFCSQCKEEEIQTSIEKKTSAIGPIPDGVKQAATGIITTSYYLINSLPSGYVKDGSVDYTSYIQAAVTKYSNIVFPGFPLMVNDSGIIIGSNKTITFQTGSEIRLKPTSSSGYSILKIANSTNITLYNPVIVGDRAKHLGTTGEWGMGIGIYGSSNVTIYNAQIKDCWGDGIYLGQIDSRINCKNIIIKDSSLWNNRRAGLSVIGVDGLLLENLYAGYNKGTVPGSGINFEANNPTSELKNIRINNPTTEFNGERGIQVTGHHMLNSSTNKYIDIDILNHIDRSSPYSAFKFSVNNIDGTSAKMYGTINIINPSWQRTANNRPLHVLSSQTGVKIVVSSPEVISAAGTLLSWIDTYNLLIKAGPLVSVLKDIPATITSLAVSNNVVFAVNAGGAAFTASDGILYSADKNYSSGRTYQTSSSISNTSDDILYQSERYGNFTYDIPLPNGNYEITFKVTEAYHKASGRRRFDIFAENILMISGLDIYSLSGYATKYDLVKPVTVSDGTLNLKFQTEIDNAKICAIHIIQK